MKGPNIGPGMGSSPDFVLSTLSASTRSKMANFPSFDKLSQLDLGNIYQAAQQSTTVCTVASTALILSLAWFLFETLKPSPFPLVNGKKSLEFSNVRVKRNFMLGAREMIAKHLERVPELPFRIMADVGEILILPPKYAYEIRNHDHLSFTQAAFKVCSIDKGGPEKLLTCEIVVLCASSWL